MSDKTGRQSIGCEVTSCRYNSHGSECDLHSIMIRPCQNCCSGRAEDETLCGSYEAK